MGENILKSILNKYNLCNVIEKKFNGKINWINISKYEELPERFIEIYKDTLNWYYISKNSIISENLIEKYNDKIDWRCILQYQNISENFVKKYKYKIIKYKKYLLKNKKINIAKICNILHMNFKIIFTLQSNKYYYDIKLLFL